MADSLKNTTELQQPTYTEANIHHMLSSEIGQQFAFVVVEDVDDKSTYEKFITDTNVHVMISKGEDGTCGYKNVENIVTNIRRDKKTERICGIRDSDYTRYLDYEYRVPDAVFLTDQRDLEMMLLATTSVQVGLFKWNNEIKSLLPLVYRDGRQMGYLRICNDVCELGCNFKKKVKLSKVWDANNHHLEDNWENKLHNLFVTYCSNICSPHYPYSTDKLTAFIERKQLYNEPDYYICQGHDVVWLLYNSLSKNNFDIRIITKKIIENFSYEDFSKTQLFVNIKGWANNIGISI